MQHSKFTVKIITIWGFLCFVGFFVVTSPVRYAITTSALIRTINIPSIIGSVGILVYCYKKKANDHVVLSKLDWFLFVVLLIIYGISKYLYSETASKTLAQIVTMILPAIVCSYRFKRENDYLHILSMFMTFIRICVVIMLATAVIDLFTDFSITRIIAESTGIASLQRMYRYRRAVSYMGHPLFSSEIYLVYYIFETLYNKYVTHKKIGITYFIITVFGIAIAQSKTVVVLILIIFMLYNFNSKRSKYLVLGLAFIAMGMQLGLFDGVIERFLTSIEMGDLTTGRNSGLEQLLSAGLLRFELLKGQFYSGDSGSVLSAALEYPMLNWAYRMGILTSIMISIILFVKPLVTVLRAKNRDVLFGLLIIIADVNTFNGITYESDKVLLYCLVCCFLVNLCYVGQSEHGSPQMKME